MICCLCTCRWQHHSGSNCQCHNQFYKQLQYWDWVSRRPDNGISVSRSVPTVVCPLVHAHPRVLPYSAEGIPEPMPPKTIILVVPWAATGVIFAFTALGVIFALVCSVLTCALWNRRYIWHSNVVATICAQSKMKWCVSHVLQTVTSISVVQASLTTQLERENTYWQVLMLWAYYRFCTVFSSGRTISHSP